jgi:integrase
MVRLVGRRPGGPGNDVSGRERLIAVGPRAQTAIKSMMTSDQPLDAPVFSPKRAMAEHVAAKRSARKTKVQPSQVCRKKLIVRKEPGDQYTTISYNRAVRYAIRRALAVGVAVKSWHVNQLRHTRATELRKMFGIESASSVLGHAELRVTEVYAEKSLELARRVAAETG